ncbi:MAG: DUF3168 domain-containing protein [Firmicutes bacterium]|nr:DUF3168 domain-containing protein [Bacillota bacterium]
MIEFDVYAYLSNHPDLVAMVGDEIYPIILPQREEPYPYDWAGITYFLVSHPEVYSKDGPAGLSFPRLQISVWSNAYTKAKQVAELVKKVMHGYAEFATKEGENDIYEPDTKLYHIPLDFIIQHKE